MDQTSVPVAPWAAGAVRASYATITPLTRFDMTFRAYVTVSVAPWAAGTVRYRVDPDWRDFHRKPP